MALTPILPRRVDLTKEYKQWHGLDDAADRFLRILIKMNVPVWEARVPSTHELASTLYWEWHYKKGDEDYKKDSDYLAIPADDNAIEALPDLTGDALVNVLWHTHWAKDDRQTGWMSTRWYDQWLLLYDADAGTLYWDCFGLTTRGLVFFTFDELVDRAGVDHIISGTANPLLATSNPFPVHSLPRRLFYCFMRSSVYENYTQWHEFGVFWHKAYVRLRRFRALYGTEPGLRYVNTEISWQAMIPHDIASGRWARVNAVTLPWNVLPDTVATQYLLWLRYKMGILIDHTQSWPLVAKNWLEVAHAFKNDRFTLFESAVPSIPSKHAKTEFLGFTNAMSKDGYIGIAIVLRDAKGHFEQLTTLMDTAIHELAHAFQGPLSRHDNPHGLKFVQIYGGLTQQAIDLGLYHDKVDPTTTADALSHAIDMAARTTDSEPSDEQPYRNIEDFVEERFRVSDMDGYVLFPDLCALTRKYGLTEGPLDDIRRNPAGIVGEEDEWVVTDEMGVFEDDTRLGWTSPKHFPKEHDERSAYDADDFASDDDEDDPPVQGQKRALHDDDLPTSKRPRLQACGCNQPIVLVDLHARTSMCHECATRAHFAHL